MGSSLRSFTKSLGSSVPVKPVTFILGATGTGKSDLAVAIGKRFNGEVINADAMQLYQGLNIVTNKVTVEEQEGVPHHLLGILTPTSLSYTIHDYKREATAIIQQLLSEGKMPIVVGGTNYYAESLLWESLIPKHEPDQSSRFVPEETTINQQTLSFMKEEEPTDEHDTNKPELDKEETVALIKSLDTNYMRLHIEKVDSIKIHALLMRADPDTARTMHPNQTRKAIRALEVLKHHGKTQSEFLSEINDSAGEQTFGAKLSYPNSVVIWLQCDKEVLDCRLDSRVGKMMELGLIKELQSFHCNHNSQLLTKSADEGHGDYTRGIFQSIGFKEFHPYLLLSDDEQSSDAGQKLLTQGITAMKFATKRYAKYQNRWVKKQFFEERNPEVVPPVYVFDSTVKSHYMTNVVAPAITLIEEILRGEMPYKPRHVMETKAKESNKVVYETCAACDVICVRKTEWENHLKSRKHHKRMRSLRQAKERKDNAYLDLSQLLTRHEKQISQTAKSVKSSDSAD